MAPAARTAAQCKCIHQSTELLQANTVKHIWFVVQLEAAATLGVVVILAVLGIIIQTSIRAGLPAIRSGELPLWTFQVRLCPVHKPLCTTIVTSFK